MYKELDQINIRPKPFQYYTAEELWTNEHTSKKMLEYHLNDAIDISSRNKTFIEHSVNWIIHHFNVDDKTEIADFGCGPGLYTNKLAEFGANITGIDFSENSPSYAKQIALQNDLKINYICKNYLDFETTKRFDLTMMIMCDYCALSPVQRKKMLTKYLSFLSPGGSVLLDVYSLNAFNQQEESATYEVNYMNNFWSPNNYYCFVNKFRYEEEKVTLDKYTIIEKARKRIVYNWLQYFSTETLVKEFEDNGFIVESLYSDVAGKEYNPKSKEIAVVATKIE